MSSLGRKSLQPAINQKSTSNVLCRPGATVLTFGLPILIYASILFCNDVSGCPAPALLGPQNLTWGKLLSQTQLAASGLPGLFDLNVFGWVCAYYGLLVVLQLVLPGEELDGTVLNTGGRLHYKFNTFNTAILIFAGLAAGTAVYGADFAVWTYCWDNLLQIQTGALIICTVQAIYVYLASFTIPHPGQPNPEHREIALGYSGNIIYDFFIGREKNPRLTIPSSIPLIGGQVIDIKLFNEMRPGLIGYCILDLAFIAHQYKVHGYITDSILLITSFQIFYVLDGLYMEPAILTTIDCIQDGFGFMLSFGDIAWLPALYSLQTRYLAVHPVNLGIQGIAGVLAIQGIGYYIFRSANNEKNRFRTDPTDPRVAHLESISTETGSKLLTSGWWGRARHINYFGDWIMAFSYCLPTGIAGYLIDNYQNPVTGNVTSVLNPGPARGWGMIFTYFYIIYFGVLLVHRERRDEEKCRKKYGKDWERYCKIVPYRIIPYVY